MRYVEELRETMVLNKIKRMLANEGFVGSIRHSYAFFLSRMAPKIMLCLNKLPKKNMIVFSHFAGKPYGGNPAMLTEEIICRKLPYQLVWIIDKNGQNSLPASVKGVPIHSLRQFYVLSRAKVWVDDCRKPQFIRKEKNQYYIQTWHGGGPCLKKVEGDAENTLSSEYIKDARHDSEMADLFISACEWRTNNYRSAFWYEGEILKCGTPTSDVYMKDSDSIRKLVYETFAIKPEKKVALYAPTFRNDHDTKYYKINYINLLRCLSESFGGEWSLIIRLHPTISNLSDFIEYDNDIINGSEYPQFEDLLIASDLLITDYSGCMFDAYRLKKPVFIYASDYKDYVEKERDLYFQLDELPASIALNEDELRTIIHSFDNEKYLSRVNTLLESVGYYPFSNATKVVVDRITRIMEER